MSLDRFRSVDIRIDKADHYFMSSQFAKGGDYNGRTLVVQITNGGLIESQAGITVNLGWRHESVKNSGLDPFEVVDAAQGIFEISYPREMLNPGRVTAVIQIIDGETITETKNFVIQVEKSPIDETSIVSSNSFTVLQEALIKVNDWNARIDAVEADFIQRANDMEAIYPQQLVSLGSQLAETATKAELSAIATPKAVSLANQMTDITKVYVYTGSEGGYTAGNWYYHNGASWVTGGVYQATAIGLNGVTHLNLDTDVQTTLMDSNMHRLSTIAYSTSVANSGAVIDVANNKITIPTGETGSGTYMRYLDNTYKFKKDTTITLYFKISVSKLGTIGFNRLLKVFRGGVANVNVAPNAHIPLKKLTDTAYLAGATFELKAGDTLINPTIEVTNSTPVTVETVIQVLDVFIQFAITDKVSDLILRDKTLYRSTKNYKTFLQHSTDYMSIVGIDKTTNPPTYYGVNLTQGTLHQKSGAFGAWGTNKGFPAGVTADYLRKVVRFKGYLYVTAKDGADEGWKVYRALPSTVVNDVFVWSAALLVGSTGSTFTLPTGFNCDSSYLYIGDYGHPTAGPSIYRSTDGVTWTTSRAADINLDHIHAINADPYRDGWVWATTGDTQNTKVILSKDYGATWQNVKIDYELKSVQISFSPEYVWLASDALYGGSVFCINRDELIPFCPALNAHSQIAVPGGAVGDMFYNIAFIGCVDPAQEIYYFVANDTSAGGNTAGLFYLHKIGGQINLISKVTLQSTNSNFPEVYISEEYVVFGNYMVKRFLKK